MRLYAFGVHNNVKPLPQSAAGVERSMYSAAWNEPMKLEIDGHKMTATYTRRRNVAKGATSCRSTWVFSQKNNQAGLIGKTKARRFRRRDLARGCRAVLTLRRYQFPQHQRWLKLWRRPLQMLWRDWITIDKRLDVAQALFFTANLTVKYVWDYPMGVERHVPKYFSPQHITAYGVYISQSGRQWAGLLVETVAGYVMGRIDPWFFRKAVNGKNTNNHDRLCSWHRDIRLDERYKDCYASLVAKYSPTN